MNNDLINKTVSEIFGSHGEIQVLLKTHLIKKQQNYSWQKT